MEKIIVFIVSFILAASILVPLFVGIWSLIKAPNQKKMFNQLVEGDYVWRVDEDGVTHFTVEKVKYDFDSNKQVSKIKIYYGDAFLDYIETYPGAAKSFKFGNWHTIKAAAELEYNKIKNKKDEAILGVTSCTTEDIKKASEKLIKQLEYTK